MAMRYAEPDPVRLREIRAELNSNEEEGWRSGMTHQQGCACYLSDGPPASHIGEIALSSALGPTG